MEAKAEKPVSRRISGDMGLVHPADGERLGKIPVGPLTGQSVLLVKRTLMLVYHDPVLFQSLVAVPVKFPGEQAFSRPKGSVESTMIRSYSSLHLRINFSPSS